MESERAPLVEESPKYKINVTDGMRSTYVPENKTTVSTIDTKRKKKFIIIGIIAFILIVALTVTLVLVLKKHDDNPGSDPTVYYNPYQVLEANPMLMYYKIARNTDLAF
jgi:flagellar basal body-associated protein FliL